MVKVLAALGRDLGDLQDILAGTYLDKMMAGDSGDRVIREHGERVRSAYLEALRARREVARLDAAGGPDLLGVTKKREREWLTRWIAAPDQMLEEKDPIAMGLYAKYDNLPMPNMRLSKVDVTDLLRYMSSESNRVRMQEARARRARRGTALASASVADVPASHSGDQPSGDQPSGDAVAIMNAWIRQAHPDATVNAGYMTLINVGSEDLTLIKLESPAFEKIELHEMARVDGLMKMRELTEMVVPAGGQARFEPGGRHLMLKAPERHLIDGQTVDLTLTFRSGRRQTVSVRVADR